MSQVDRIAGLTGTLGVKAPALVVATANIALTGLQTIDGVTLLVGDRILVTGQTNLEDNGVWEAATGTWSRAPDFDGARDIAQGTVIIVASGAVYANTAWQITTANPEVGSALTISPASFGAEALATELADTTSAVKGSSLVGFNSALAYAAGTVGGFLKSLIASTGSSLIGFIQAGTGGVAQTLQARLRKVVYDSDFSTVQEAIDYCLSFGANAPVLEITQTHTLTSALILNRPTNDPATSRGKFVIRGRSANCGFAMYGAGVYMFENNIVGYSENVVFDNIWFQSDHSANGGAGYTGVIKGADFIRVTFNDCYFQEIGVEPSCATYIQSFYFNHCKFVSWNGPIIDCLAFYDLSVVGCQFESGNYAGSKGFSAYDATATTSTQKASFVANMYENCQGPFATIQSGRGVVAVGNYFEANVDQVFDFQQGVPKGVFVAGNSFDTGGAAATYAPIIVSYPNGFFGSGNWSSTRLYRFINEMADGATSQGGSWGQGDSTDSGELLSSTSPIGVATRVPGGIQVFRAESEEQHVRLDSDGGVSYLDSTNTGSAAYIPLLLRQKNNAATRNCVAVKSDGTVALNLSAAGVTLDENLTMAFFQASTTQLRITVKCSDGVERTANIAIA